MTQDSQRIERDVQAALEAEPARIAERVRTITLEALTRGVVDTQALREVTQAVLRGAQADPEPCRRSDRSHQGRRAWTRRSARLRGPGHSARDAGGHWPQR